MELDWQMKQLSVKDRSVYIFKTGFFSDCSFRVGDILGEQRIFRAHKYVLCTASPVFERLLFWSFPSETNELIDIADVDADIFYSLLQYVYCDIVDINTMTTAYKLYFASKKYMLEYLNKRCLEYVVENLSAQNVLDAFEFAVQLEERNLEDKCMELIRKQTSEVLKSSSFHSIGITTMMTIFDQNQLNIKKELELFEAVEKYAMVRRFFNDGVNSFDNADLELFEKGKGSQLENDWKEINQMVPQADVIPKAEAKKPDIEKEGEIITDQEKAEEMYKFKNLIKRIRFLTMNSEDFLNGPAYSPLLKPADSLAILGCILQPIHTEKRLPKGFNNSQQVRLTVAR